MQNNKIIYNVMPSKVINGTLFYAMEYFLIVNEIKVTELLLKCTKEEFDFILDVFDNKYDYDKKLNSLIIRIKFTDLLKIKSNVLILDILTYEKFITLLHTKIFLFSDKKTNICRTYKAYGYYYYQTFNIKYNLKIAFKYHKLYEEKYNTFISSANTIKSDYVSKLPNNYINLQEYHHWHYEHNGFDTNNRFIPEARYFGKNLTISEIRFNDSITDVYTKDINKCILTKDDKLIQDFINEKGD